jgi:hypothetical protein
MFLVYFCVFVKFFFFFFFLSVWLVLSSILVSGKYGTNSVIDRSLLRPSALEPIPSMLRTCACIIRCYVRARTSDRTAVH